MKTKFIIVICLCAIVGMAVIGYSWYFNYEDRLLAPGIEACLAKKYAKAIPYLEQYLQYRRIDRWEPYAALATAYEESEKAYDKSERILNDGISSLKGKNRDSLRDLLASQYLERSMFAAAIHTYESMETISDAEKKYAVGFAYSLQKNYLEAIRHLEVAVSESPRVSELDYVKTHPNAYLLLAHNYYRNGDSHMAAVVVNSALKEGFLSQKQVDETSYLPASMKIKSSEE